MRLIALIITRIIYTPKHIIYEECWAVDNWYRVLFTDEFSCLILIFTITICDINFKWIKVAKKVYKKAPSSLQVKYLEKRETPQSYYMISIKAN